MYNNRRLNPLIRHNVVNIYAFKEETQKHKKKKLRELNGPVDKLPLIVRDLNTSL